MAKCIGFITDWKIKTTEPTSDHDFLIDDATKGEEFLGKKLEYVTSSVFNIAESYTLIEQTIESNGLKVNCTEVRDYLMSELKQLNLDTHQTTDNVSKSKLSLLTKQKYFILYSSGVIAQLQQLLQLVGRLSGLEQKIYLSEQQNLFISDESMVIHALASVWSASINIMYNLQTSGRILFEEADSDPDDYSFADQMEFSTSCNHYAKVFIMDLLITSWTQFNRLVKFDDLVKGMPFLCMCNCKLFFTTLRLFGEEERNRLLSEMLPLIIDYQKQPSMMSESLRQHNIVPLEPCYISSDQQALAYFVVWNIYALSRIVKPVDRPMISNCKKILESSYSIAMKQFEAIIDQPGFQLSPHQEERHKLLTHLKFSLENWDKIQTPATTT